jgi:hypothetical protein
MTSRSDDMTTTKMRETRRHDVLLREVGARRHADGWLLLRKLAPKEQLHAHGHSGASRGNNTLPAHVTQTTHAHSNTQ